MATAPSTTWTIIAGTGTGGGGGGGGQVPGAAPPVTIDATAPDGSINPVLIPRSNQQYEVALYYTLSPLATAQNFSGVAIYLEDPDISSQPAMQLNGTSTLDGTKQTSSNWVPVFENNNHSTWSGSTETHGPADFLLGNPKPNLTYRMARNIRIYLASFGPNTTPQLVRANQPNPTPNIMFAVAAPGSSYTYGEEYAWLVKNVQATLETDFNRPDPTYRIEYSYTPPDPNIPIPPGMNPFGGCEIFFAYPDAKNTNPLYAITDSGVFVPMTASNGYLSPAYDPGNGGSFRVYFCSGDNSNPAHVNSLIPGVTPYAQVTVTYPPTDSSGNVLPTTPDITGLTLTNPVTGVANSTYMAWQPDGSMLAEIHASWVNPTSPSYAGLEFYVTAINPPDPNYKLPRQLADVGSNMTGATFAVLDWPKTTEQWTITAVSLDSYNKQNNDPNNPRANSMTAIWTIGPPGPGGTGQEAAPLVTPLQLPTPVVKQQVSSDGVQMMSFTVSGWTDPTSNQFGGAKVAMVYDNGTVYWDAGKATTFTTPWIPAVTTQTIYFYIVSYNPQNQQNSIVPQPGGQTPFTSVVFTPTAGAVKASQIPTDWFSTNDFVWQNGPGAFDPAHPTTTGLQVAQIDAGRVQVGTVLRVGGAPSTSSLAPSFRGQNGQIAVYSSGTDPGDQGTPTLRAWMGQQNIAGTPVYGGWFSELYVGGNGPPTSPLYVHNNGLLKLGGWDVLKFSPTQTYYPYISVRNESDTEVGRIGAHLPQTSDALPVGDHATGMSGAWFTQFAAGGLNFADWRFLAAPNNNLYIRNVNVFEIDYKANIAGLTNQPYQLLLGTDTAFSPIGGTSFPGITLMRENFNNAVPPVLVPTTHGISIINRGIILGAADPNVAQTQRVALVTFNGDSNGGDAPGFWGELVMFSPTTGNQNITFSSGGLDNANNLIGAASLTLLDDKKNLRFQVRVDGVIFMPGAVYGGAGGAVPMIDSSGNWIGPIKTSSFSAASYSVSGPPVLSVIDSSGQFVGSNISITSSHWIDCGQITASNVAVRGYSGGPASNPTQVIDGSGNWTGVPITGAQTPWAGTIDGNNKILIHANQIVSYSNTFTLTDRPQPGTAILAIAGPGPTYGNGIEIYSQVGVFLPVLNLQSNDIGMVDANNNEVFHVDGYGHVYCTGVNRGISRRVQVGGVTLIFEGGILSDIE